MWIENDNRKTKKIGKQNFAKNQVFFIFDRQRKYSICERGNDRTCKIFIFMDACLAEEDVQMILSTFRSFFGFQVSVYH